MKKSYYETCPVCGAHLDPGERCECCSLNDEFYEIDGLKVLKNIPVKTVQAMLEHQKEVEEHDRLVY